MKKTALLLVFVLTAGMLLAEDAPVAAAQALTYTAGERTIIVYDPIKHTETASNIFFAWAGLSIGGGILAATSKEPLGQGIGIGNIIYGIVETALAIVNINWGEKITDPEKARLKMVDDCGWRAWSGLGHMTAGALLAIFGDNNSKGLGVAMALQGSFISISNTLNYSIANDPKNIRDWGAGIEIKYPLLTAAF